MSGSSLDGLDIAHCRFDTSRNNGNFKIENWEILHAETFPFSSFWKNRLSELPKVSAFKLAGTHAAFGHYLAELTNLFIEKNNIVRENIDCIASHGHTVFHEPEKGFTTQIGDGAALAAITKCTVVNDFRSADIALGGQGAPLAPMADKMLLQGHDFYLNLGGIANITCNINGRFVAFDICGTNQILNALANKKGKEYDDGGKMASSGELIIDLYKQQKNIPFFKKNYPKSLSNQWVQKNQTAIFLENKSKLESKLFTACKLIADLIFDEINKIIKIENFKKEKYSLLIAGGGAYNDYLIKRIQYSCKKKNIEIVIPENKIIGFKEAALMALMGVMRLEGVPNCMASVTGAERDVVGGAVFYY